MLEGRVHHPALEPIQHPTLAGGQGIGGLALGQLLERFASLEAGLQGVNLLLGDGLVLVGDQDVRHLAALQGT